MKDWRDWPTNDFYMEDHSKTERSVPVGQGYDGHVDKLWRKNINF